MREPLATVTGFCAPAGPIDLDVNMGEVVHLRGGNGCGKTSLLRHLAGLDAPLQCNRVAVLRRDPHDMPGPELAQAVRAVWASPNASLVGLTVAGEFQLRGFQLPPALHALGDRDAATLSSGEARHVALAVAAASPAPLLLLDEPCEALDGDGLEHLALLVREAASRGAVVIADHTGWAATIATRSVDLGPSSPSIGLVLPRPPAGDVLLTSPPAQIRRGSTPLDVPGLHVAPGFHVVTGRNGAGKSTLLQRLAGLRDADGVLVAGAAPEPGRTVRLLQPGAGDLLMERTVRSELGATRDAEGLVPSGLLDRHPLSLSAGEAQRVAIAKSLGHAATVHLLDEPEAHLDADARWRLLAAIARRLADGACVVAATHDAALIAAAHSRTEVGP
ncbi:MAG: ATP-binding cassette domain-containing protein [Candidatus Thermoplasmatota archaeon]